MRSIIEAYITEQTCGEACWSAREDICRCSCGGANHGCLRDKNGVQPVRTSRIDGYVYELKAVGYDDVEKLAAELNGDLEKKWHNVARSRESFHKDIPAKLRHATASQIAKWPELAAYRNLEPHEWGPDLLWVRA